MNRVNYIDVYSTQLTIEEFNRLFHERISSEEEFERERLYEVKLRHRRVDRGTTFDEKEVVLPELRNCEGEYIFKVHNVGQGLATSLACSYKNPFFYFDYGLAHGRNKFTIPAGTILPIKEQGIIVLSHIHQDHLA